MIYISVPIVSLGKCLIYKIGQMATHENFSCCLICWFKKC